MRTGGEKALAFTFGLNEEALTFNLFAAVGDNGPEAPLVLMFVCTLALAGAVGTGAAGELADGATLLRLPLNGGIA